MVDFTKASIQVLNPDEMKRIAGGSGDLPSQWQPPTSPFPGSPDPGIVSNPNPGFVGPPYMPPPPNPFAFGSKDLSANLGAATTDLSQFGRPGVPQMLGD